MELARAERPDAAEIGAFFEPVFAASDSPEEGRLVGRLARDLILTVPEADIAVLTCREGTELLGCIILTRLVMPEEARVVFLLAPVGVATAPEAGDRAGALAPWPWGDADGGGRCGDDLWRSGLLPAGGVPSRHSDGCGAAAAPEHAAWLACLRDE